MTRLLTTGNGVLMNIVVLAVGLAANGKAAANEAVYRRVIHGVALVMTDKSIGSGVLVDADRRLLATADHVPGEADEVSVMFAQFDGDGDVITDRNYYLNDHVHLAIRGKVIRRNPQADLALIQLERLPEGVRALPLARPRLAQNVHVIGNSSITFGGLFGCRQGMIANLYRFPLSYLDCRAVEYDIPEFHGDSGGPVFNDRGEVVAIVHGRINDLQGSSKMKDPHGTEVIVPDFKAYQYGIDAREIMKLLDSVKDPVLVPPAANPSLPRTGPDR